MYRALDMLSASSAKSISNPDKALNLTGKTVIIGVLAITRSVVVADLFQGKFYENEVDLKVHYNEHTGHPFCVACGQCCSELDIYEHYDNRDHPECTHCDRLFAKEALLKTHQLIDHNHCPQCNLFFRSVSHLDAHLASRRHEGALVMCPGDDCGRTFIKASELLQHFASETCFPYEAGV